MVDKIKEAMLKPEPISLKEMDSVKLMERVDSKYVFPAEYLPSIIEGMREDYRILEIDNIRLHRYKSLYYDTPDFALYKWHHRNLLNRWKFRFREYIDSKGLTFFEAKFKNNQSRTIKKRIKISNIESGINKDVQEFMQKISPYSGEMLESKMYVNYSRMTFVNRFSQERLTIDVDLQFIRADKTGKEQIVHFPNLVIAEAKRDKASSVSQFVRMIRLLGIRESGISKYCFGVYNLFEGVKKNNFKPRVRFIHKMAHTDLSLINIH